MIHQAMRAALPRNEPARFEVLRRYKILDTPPEREFDEITLLASYICRTPTALVTLVDEYRHWFKSSVGWSTEQTDGDLSFCAHAILGSGLCIVRDATEDPRFADNLLVAADPKIRFYAGAPLITPDGHSLGTICVIDYVPRTLDARRQYALEAVARSLMMQLELRRARYRRDRGHKKPATRSPR